MVIEVEKILLRKNTCYTSRRPAMELGSTKRSRFSIWTKKPKRARSNRSRKRRERIQGKRLDFWAASNGCCFLYILHWRIRGRLGDGKPVSMESSSTSSRFRFRDLPEMENSTQSDTASDLSSVSSDREDDETDLQSMTGKVGSFCSFNWFSWLLSVWFPRKCEEKGSFNIICCWL